MQNFLTLFQEVTTRLCCIALFKLRRGEGPGFEQLPRLCAAAVAAVAALLAQHAGSEIYERAGVSGGSSCA